MTETEPNTLVEETKEVFEDDNSFEPNSLIENGTSISNDMLAQPVDSTLTPNNHLATEKVPFFKIQSSKYRRFKHFEIVYNLKHISLINYLLK
jgi:hypothetical protein